MAPAFVSYDLASAKLRALVCSAWGQAYDDSQTMLPGLIAPDAHVEIVFQLGAPCRLVSGERVAMSPQAMVHSVRHGSLRLEPTGANRMVAIRLAPGVASVVLDASLGDCWDRVVALRDLIGGEADDLLDQLSATPLPAAGAVLEAWLLSRLADWGLDHERERRLHAALLWDIGGEPVSRLADRLGFTARTLRRRCGNYAGLSPKQIVMSGRMLRACDLLRTRNDLPLADVAQRLGFSDQSAFTNAFGQYLGMTPAQLRAEPLVFYQPPA